MSQLVLDNGDIVGVTWLSVQPNTVVQIKTLAKEGYTAIQLGAGQAKKSTKPRLGHLQKLDAKILKEIKVDDPSLYQRGDKVDVSVFQVGDLLTVTATSKGKGFAGTIRRHNFKSGPGGHGHDHHRQPGSIGAMGMARVNPGHRMSGHLGDDQVTMKNLRVVAVDQELARLAVRGSIPGNNKNWILIKKHA